MEQRQGRGPVLVGPLQPGDDPGQHGRAGRVRGHTLRLLDPSYEELLQDRLRVLDPDNPQTLTTRGNLARWRGEAGDAAGAAAAFDQLLEDFLRFAGGRDRFRTCGLCRVKETRTPRVPSTDNVLHHVVAAQRRWRAEAT
jgi:hypothetical protein